MNKNNFKRIVENKLSQEYVKNRLINMDRVIELLELLKVEKNNDEIKNIIETIKFEFETINLSL